MFHDNVLFGVVQNLIAFPSWRGETEEGVDILYRIIDDPFFGVVDAGWIADAGIRNRVRDRAVKSGKEVTYGCGPTIFAEGLDLNSFDQAVRDKSIKRIIELADDAVQYGAKTLLIASGKDVADDKREEAYTLLADSLIRLCDCCCNLRPEAPIVVALELFDTGIDKMLLAGDSDTAATLAENIISDAPNFALCLDLSHLPLMGEEASHAVPAVRPFLKHIHIGNCAVKDPAHPLYGDKHPPFGAEGCEIGRAEVQAFFKVLEENGYDTAPSPTRKPVIISEIIAAPGQDSAYLLENIKAAVRPAV